MSQTIDHWLVSLNSIGRAFCHYAADAFTQSALLVIVLFTLDLLLRRRVRAVVRYSVWLLVLVKLVLPPTLALPTGIGYWLGNRPSAVAPELQGSPETVGFELARPPRPEPLQPSNEIPESRLPAQAGESEGLITPAASSLPPVTWQAILFLFWVGGVVAFAALLAQRLRFVKGLVAASTPAGPELLGLLEQCRGQIGVRREVALRMLDTLPSPAVCGLRRPTILMPAPLVERLTPAGLRVALIHELAHIKRADLWINAVQTVLQVIYFYNPFVWLANAMIRRTCEEAVDETVLVTLGGQARDYSNTLINISEMAFWKGRLRPAPDWRRGIEKSLETEDQTHGDTTRTPQRENRSPRHPRNSSPGGRPAAHGQRRKVQPGGVHAFSGSQDRSERNNLFC
jgi:beta-lactamase regulating signal transducer with metallopeptidase domain